jgi:flagellar basal-body rod protein FlgF
MSGGYYVALSGMRSRLDQLDRLSEDLANASTVGFKGERTAKAHAMRPPFSDALDTAIDVTTGRRNLDMQRGNVLPTGRALDLALQGDNFLAVQTEQGVRYTRNGQLARSADGRLVTSDGAAALGEDGPLKIEEKGDIRIGADGSVRVGNEVKGKLSVVTFADPRLMTREGGALLRAPEGVEAVPAEGEALVSPGAIEESNVSVVERMGELADLARSFQAMQKALSVLMNDVDGRVIESLGRR